MLWGTASLNERFFAHKTQVQTVGSKSFFILIYVQKSSIVLLFKFMNNVSVYDSGHHIRGCTSEISLFLDQNMFWVLKKKEEQFVTQISENARTLFLL